MEEDVDVDMTEEAIEEGKEDTVRRDDKGIVGSASLFVCVCNPETYLIYNRSGCCCCCFPVVVVVVDDGAQMVEVLEEEEIVDSEVAQTSSFFLRA